MPQPPQRVDPPQGVPAPYYQRNVRRRYTVMAQNFRLDELPDKIDELHKQITGHWGTPFYDLEMCQVVPIAADSDRVHLIIVAIRDGQEPQKFI